MAELVEIGVKSCDGDLVSPPGLALVRMPNSVKSLVSVSCREPAWWCLARLYEAVEKSAT